MPIESMETGNDVCGEVFSAHRFPYVVLPILFQHKQLGTVQ